MASRIIGRDRVLKRLERMSGKATKDRVSRALFAAGEMVQIEAQVMITAGAVSGKGHVPSRPGEPPNADTHFLANNIETRMVSPKRVEVSSNAPYSAALEFGTSKMGERPFMRPALARKRKEAADLVRKAAKPR